MRLAQLDTRKAEIVVGALLVATAAIVVRETVRLGAGWGLSGPQPGFFPAIAALLMAVGAVVLIVRAARGPGRPLFDSQDQAVSVLKVGAPLVAAVVSLQYLGFYLMTALYVGLFALWYGRYRWYVALSAGLVLPIALFLAFERGFRIPLPKSVLYPSILPL